MNAKLLEKLIAYREKHGYAVAKLLLSQKIEYQFRILGKPSHSSPFVQHLANATALPSLFLIEARAAREYWKRYGETVHKNVMWKPRRPHAPDPVNQLLDIGYHYLTQRIIKICAELDIPTELGLFHRAQSAHLILLCMTL